MQRLLIVVGVIVQCFAVPSIAGACGCPGESSEDMLLQVRASAERVFIGRVIRWDEETVTLSVEALWKGDVASEVTLKHGEIKGQGVVIDTCTYRFPTTGRFLVFAVRNGSTLKASNCGSGPLEKAQLAVATLDATSMRRVPQ